MDYKTGLLLVTFLAGSLALPAPEDDFFFFRYDKTPRIVGGTPAAEGSHPHLVALTSGLLIKQFRCGGSLITQRTVLTAAHCIGRRGGNVFLSSSLRVTVGTNRWNSGGASYRLTRGVNHANYDNTNIKNDIGILITSNPVVLGPNVQLVPLSFDAVGGGVPVLAAGWGAMWAQGPASPDLLEVQLTTLSGQECIDGVGNFAAAHNLLAPHIDPQVEICTVRGPGHGVCQGDSGSPLRCIADGIQIGVVSWGFPCAHGAPDMYVRVSGFEDWIKTNTV